MAAITVPHLCMTVALLCCLLGALVPVQSWQTEAAAELPEKGGSALVTATQRIGGDLPKAASSLPNHQFSRRALLHVQRKLAENSTRKSTIQNIIGTGGSSVDEVITVTNNDNNLDVRVGNQSYTSCRLDKTVPGFTNEKPFNEAEASNNANIGFNGTVQVGARYIVFSGTIGSFNGEKFYGKVSTFNGGPVTQTIPDLKGSNFYTMIVGLDESIFSGRVIGHEGASFWGQVTAFNLNKTIGDDDRNLEKMMLRLNERVLTEGSRTSFTQILEVLCTSPPPSPPPPPPPTFKVTYKNVANTTGNPSSKAFAVFVGNQTFSSCRLNKTVPGFNGIFFNDKLANTTAAIDFNGTVVINNSSTTLNGTIGGFNGAQWYGTVSHVGGNPFNGSIPGFPNRSPFNGTIAGFNESEFNGTIDSLINTNFSGTVSAFNLNKTLERSNLDIGRMLEGLNETELSEQNATVFVKVLEVLCTRGLPPLLPPLPPLAPPKGSSKGFPVWAIPVIVAAAAVALVVAGILVWRLYFLKRRGDADKDAQFATKDEPMLNEREAYSPTSLPTVALLSVRGKGGNEVIRESDLQPQKYLSTVESAAQAVRKLAQEVLARARGDERCAAALLQFVRSRGLPQEAALAVVEELCARALLRNFENPGLQDGEYRTSMTGDERRAFFRGIHDQVVYGPGAPSGFKRYLETRKAELLRRFAKKLSLPENEASEVLFPPDVISHIDRAALLVYAVNAGAFAFQRPAYLLWADDAKADPGWFRSSNPRVEKGEVGVSVFPATVITENQLAQGRVFAL